MKLKGKNLWYHTDQKTTSSYPVRTKYEQHQYHQPQDVHLQIRERCSEYQILLIYTWLCVQIRYKFLFSRRYASKTKHAYKERQSFEEMRQDGKYLIINLTLHE